MKTGKYMKKSPVKGIALALVLVLLLGCGIGGTIAWLLDTTPTVTNTFTVGKVDLTLVESPYDVTNNTYGSPAEGVTNNYPMIPGNTYKKDPKVTVTANSEDCWLFVKVDTVNNPKTYLDYTLAISNWETVETGENYTVFYKEVSSSTTDQHWNLLTADANGITVTVKDTIVNKGTAAEGTVAMPDNTPQLVFTAYAVQKANRTVEQAWALVDPTPAAP